MKLEAFSPESVGNAFLDLHEQMTAGDFLAALLVSLVSAATAALLYRFFYERRGTGSQIHRAFPLLSLAVTTLFIGVQVSLPLSLGLLGSLSIIRFRTPIKEPEEVGFIMLVIAAAICAATKNFDFILYLYLVAVVALAAANAKVGVDVESVARNLSEEFATGVFTPDELEIASKCAKAAQALIRFWCSKEAVSKALGTGR